MYSDFLFLPNGLFLFQDLIHNITLHSVIMSPLASLVFDDLDCFEPYWLDIV